MYSTTFKYLFMYNAKGTCLVCLLSSDNDDYQFVLFHRTMTNTGQHSIISEYFSSLKVFFYTVVVFCHLYIRWIKGFNIIADPPNSWVVFSKHFHLHFESVSYVLSCKSLATTAMIKVFSLNYYSQYHPMWFYVLRKVDKYAFMYFIREF